MVDEPLRLTVHALPSVAAQAPLRRSVGRWKALALVLLVSLPLVLGGWAAQHTRLQGQARWGHLVQPPQPMPAVQVRTADARVLPLQALRGQWLLVYPSSGHCDAPCQRHLVLMRQLWLMLGKDRDRMDWIWLVTDEAVLDEALLAHLQRDRATVVRVPAAALQGWLGVHAAAAEPALQLVDPMGRWMMTLPVPQDPAGARQAKRDLELLLRASAGWDAPGREADRG